ncbi:MAG TPA: DUF3048 domain-containing protein [Candidatus Limnocylindria bacterium]|nr:DUF3048 domain-containing protein [Candidatus Limnocylindria bacterium]
MRRTVVVLVTLLVAASCGGQTAAPAASSQPAAGSATPAVWPLRGTAAPDAASVRKRPIVVKIDANPAARPQAGLADADLILEIVVEGGVTRYAAVFHSKDPAKVGPVRSARKSDLNYLSSLHPILAHVGASEAVAKLIREAAASADFVDVDELQQADAFERAKDRQPPYNAYTSGAKVRAAGGRPASDAVTVAGLRYGTATGGTDAATLTIPYPEAVRYEYDGTGAYHRSYPGGAKTMDAAGEVLPANVVVIKTDYTELAGTADASGAASVDYRATGSGPVVILRDGKRFEGTWTRPGDGLYAFADASGAPILLKAGLTWLHIVPLTFDLRP